MKPFDYSVCTDLDVTLEALGGDTVAYAGGTDLLPRMKHGVTEPARLLDIKRSGLSGAITLRNDSLTLGALTTLADIERASLPGWCRMLVDAAGQAASPQIRERATVAGNLLQRPRCWYYRDPDVSCWLKNGDGCPAREGRNEHHAIVDLSPCAAVHPSDLAACLIALDATVSLRSKTSARSVKLSELLVPPDAAHRLEHRVGDDELIIAIDMNAASRQARSVYLKAMERKVWAFALVGIAARADVVDGTLRHVSLVASGIANVPWQLSAAQRALEGVKIDADGWNGALEQATRATVEAMQPLSDNRYKVELLARLLTQAIGELASG